MSLVKEQSHRIVVGIKGVKSHKVSETCLTHKKSLISVGIPPLFPIHIHYIKVFQPWHYLHLGLDNSLL